MKVNNFDGVALVYDAIANVFFGGSLKKAQTYFIKDIANELSILVLGSGTGWIAQETLKQKPTSKITLVDASPKMTAIAIKKLKGKSAEIFCADQTKVFSKPFDVVILPCFLDLFLDSKLDSVINSIKRNAKPETLWIVTDFVSEKRWQRVYLWIMYVFFEWACNIDANHLPDWQNILAKSGFNVLQEKKFYRGFIKTVLYKAVE